MDLLILVFSAIGNLVLGLLVYLKNPHSATNKLFTALTISIVLMLIANYFSVVTQITQNPETILLWIRLAMFFAVPVSVFYLLFVVTLPNSSIPLPRRSTLLLTVLMLTTMAIAISPYLFTSLKLLGGNVQPTPGPGILLFIVTAFGSTIAAIIVLLKKFSRAKGLENVQLKLILLGTAAMFGLIIGTVFVPVSALNFTAFVPFIPVYTLAFVGSTAYAIVKHRLLDIRLVVARAVAYTLLVTFVGIFFAVSTVVTTSFLLQDLDTTQQILLYTTLTVVVALTFQPLRRVLENITDNIFYKGRYDSPELISRLTKIMATTLRLESLTRNLLTNLVPEMRLSKGAITLVRNGKIYSVDTFGFDKKPVLTSTDISSLLETDKILVRDELSQGKVKEILGELDVTSSVPLKVGRDEFGVLLLGHKLSGEIYTNQDIKILEILSPEISIAIQNAEAYEEVSKFNVKLQQEVEKATVNLRSANERLKELDKMKDDFVSVVSHELRTPMTAIKSYVWLALNGKAGKLNSKMENYLFKVYESSERLIGLVNDVLDVSHIETGRINLEIQPVSLIKTAEDVVTTLSARAAEQNLKLNLDKSKTVPMVTADPMKVNEVLVNLIGNALKFTPKGGSVTVSFAKQGSEVETFITDTGIGIPKEDLSKLFTKFGRIAKSYSTIAQSTGSGLGLYITKKYLDMMKGKVWVNSEVNKGTTFTFSLPISKEHSPKKVPKEYETVSGHINREKSKS